MRMLAVDLGKKRIGLAVGDSEALIPRALPVVHAIGSLKKDAEQVSKQAKKEECDLIVVGLPLEMDGTEARMANVMRRFGQELVALGHSVDYADESWTSKEATAEMKNSGLKGSQVKKGLDSEAACRILENYWRSLS